MTAEQKRQKALEVISRKDNGRLLTYLNSCVHCGLCAESCIFYLTTRDPEIHTGTEG